jgi:hypothetical protein
MMMIPPVCSGCAVFMRCHKNGRKVEILSGDDFEQPYQIWSGDEWLCEKCGAKIVVGWGMQPRAEFGIHKDYEPLKAYEQDEMNLIQVRR